MNRRGDEFGETLDIVAFATRFMKTYQGIVLDDQDELKKGRVLLSVPDLGWFTPSESPWAEPEYPGRGAITPAIGDTVPVYFIAGDVSRPVYRSARMGEIKGTTPPSYTGPETKILYEDADIVILYDGDVITVDAGPKRIRAKTDAGNLFTVIKTYMEHVRDATTFGSSTSHAMSAATIAAIDGDITALGKVLVE